MFLLPIPPSVQDAAALPKQVWATLGDARRAASADSKPLILFVPEDQARYDAASAFFRSFEGIKARRDAEVWLATPGSTEAVKLLDELQIRSLPALVHLNRTGKRAISFRQGQDCVPLLDAFSALFRAWVEKPELIQAWAPGESAGSFLAFSAARRKDRGAGALEPHRSWLIKLLGSKDDRLRDWAATRLVEAAAGYREGEPRAMPVLMQLLGRRFDREVRYGNRAKEESGIRPNHQIENADPKAIGQDPNPPLIDLGFPGLIAPDAPCWPRFREDLSAASNLEFSLAHYVLFAPHLKEQDKAWILKLLTSAPDAKRGVQATSSALFWIASDWLLAYGLASDWEAFRKASEVRGWNKDFLEIEDKVRGLGAYWNSSRKVQSMFCEDSSSEAFWENPDPCLAAWGVTREALVEFGMDRLQSKGTPAPPRYPTLARFHRFSTTLRIRMLVGTDGTVKWARPEPGFALAFFAPEGLEYAMKWKFEPSRVGGVARPSMFSLTMPFKLGNMEYQHLLRTPAGTR